MITAGDKPNNKPRKPDQNCCDTCNKEVGEEALTMNDAGLAVCVDCTTEPLDLTSDETDALIKMVRARIRLKQAFSESHPDLTILVAKLLNWSHNVGPGTQRGGEK